MINLVQPALAQGFSLGPEYGFGKFNTLGEALGTLVMPGFSIAATAVAIYFIIGSFRYLLSAGDKNATQGAKDMITHAIIGFILLMMAFLIIQFIPQFLDLRGFNIVK